VSVRKCIKIKIDAAGNFGETAIRFAANDACAHRIYTNADNDAEDDALQRDVDRKKRH